MASLKDDRGYNQGFKPGRTLTIRTQRRGDWMIRQMSSSQELNILEIGCGTGELSSVLASKDNLNVLATDLCAPFLEIAKEKYNRSNLEFLALDFTKPHKLGRKKFDFILGNGILHHLYHQLDQTLEIFKSLLNDNGRILFIEPNLYNPYCFIIFRTTPFFRRLANLEPDEMAFSGNYISRKLRDHSYKEVMVEFKDFLLPNTPYFLVQPTILIGSILERIPLLRYLSQSLFISAKK